MNIPTIMLLITLIMGRRSPVEDKAWAATIVNATSDEMEQRMLLVTAWAGNMFHTYGFDFEGHDHTHTPFFDITDYRNAHPHDDISMELGARVALRYLRYLHATVCAGMPWIYALGAFHGGHPRCHIDLLGRRQMGFAQILVPSSP
jgi:hypothetical protein